MSSWPMVPLKAVADITLGKMVQPEPSSEVDIEAPYLRAAHVQPNGQLIEPEEKTMWFAPKELRQLTLKRGDVVIVEGGAGFGRSAHLTSDLDGWGFQNSIIRLRPRRRIADGRFLNYVLQDMLATGETALAASVATIPHFTAEKVAAVRRRIPEPPEQQAIGGFLDRETVQIDAMIEAQQELVARLAERRNAVVLQTVRPEGCEWPYRPLKHFVKRVSGSGFPVEEQGVEGLPLPFYKVSALAPAGRDGHITEVYDTVDHPTARRLGAKVVPAGSPVMAKIGAAVLLGRVRQVTRDCCVDNNMVAFVTNGLMDDRFAYFALQQFDIKYFVNPGTLPFLNERSLLDAPIPVPGTEEQHAIAAELDRATARMDAMIDAANESIALMQERRAALISAAVTGRIDPRTGEDRAVAV